MPDAKADKTPPRSAYGQYELLYDEEIDKERLQLKGFQKLFNLSFRILFNSFVAYRGVELIWTIK